MEINEYIGSKIRYYRKNNHLTIQELADMIHKSKGTVSKYEKGDIVIDLETLYDISKALNVRMDFLTDYHEEEKQVETDISHNGNSPYFVASRLYYYFYDGKYEKLKEGIIDINKNVCYKDGSYEAVMTLQSNTKSGTSSVIHYIGNVLYSDMLIRFNFLNQYNKLEQDLLYIFNPLELREETEGLLCGISSNDLRPCAYKCLVCLNSCLDLDDLKSKLLLTTKELKRWQKINMLMVDNKR